MSTQNLTFASLNAAKNKITGQYGPGTSYGRIAFGLGASANDFKTAGLYQVIDAPASLTQYQNYTGETLVVDETARTVTRSYTGTDISPAAARAIKKTELAEKAQVEEQKGVVVDGVVYPCDALGALNITAAIATQVKVQAAKVPLKKADGSWADVTQTQAEAIELAVQTRRNALATAEKNHTDIIDALASTAVIAQHDIRTGWPNA
jgi:hypothetical protein